MTERLLARGQGASPGRATGPAAFSTTAAIDFAEKGTPAILVRAEAGAEDAPGVRVSAALITTRAGITGDGAIIARALGKPCVASCSDVVVMPSQKRLVAREVTVTEGDLLTVDATKGEILLG